MVLAWEPFLPACILPIFAQDGSQVYCAAEYERRDEAETSKLKRGDAIHDRCKATREAHKQATHARKVLTRGQSGYVAVHREWNESLQLQPNSFEWAKHVPTSRSSIMFTELL